MEQDAAFSEPTQDTVPRGCEVEHGMPTAPGRQSHKYVSVAETQTEEAETNSGVPKGPEMSTSFKELPPSPSEVGSLDLPQVLGTPRTSTPVHTQHMHMHYDFTGANVNIVRDSNVSDSQLNLVASSLNGNRKDLQDPDRGQTIKSPHRLSFLFSKACVCIAKCLDEEEKLDELKLGLQCWSCDDTTETLFPEAQAAKSVVQLFRMAMHKPLWHWLDFENLLLLLDLVSCEKARKILNDYEEHLASFCEKELSVLHPYKDSQAPPAGIVWMDVKWNGDGAKFKLGCLYQCKKFLVDHLGIPSSSFVFYELFPGCITLRWVVLTRNACSAIEALSHTGCIQFLDTEMEIKLIHPVNPPEEFCNMVESLFFGNTEYVFSQHVPQYVQCPICLGILENAVVTDCCHEALCSDCCEKWDSRKCPICRCEDYQHARDEFIDKQIVGNILAKCRHCHWTGCLWNARSPEYHPCVSDAKSVEGDLLKETAEPTNVDGQEEAGTAVALPQATYVESQEESVEKGSLVSEKEPVLEIVQNLLVQLQTLQVYIKDEAMSTSGEHLSLADSETLRAAVDGFTVLMQDVEDNFLAAEGSIASGPSRRLLDAEGVPTEAQEYGIAHGMVQSSIGEPASESNLGVTSPSVEPSESDAISIDADVRVHLHARIGETSQHEIPALLVQSPEQSAAQKALVREAQSITQLAAKAGQVSLLHQLLAATALGPDHTSYTGQSLLYTACQFGYTEMAQMLLSMKASVNFQSDNGRSPLHGAAYSGSLPCLELLLENDADVNLPDVSGDTPLHMAAQQGHAAFAKKLMNHSHTSVNMVNTCGQTPLHRASKSGNCEVIDLLLKSDAILDVTDSEGITPIHTAVKEGNTEAVKVLLDSNANPNLASSEHGLAPLHSAARQAEGLQLIQLLHAAGADATALDHKGRSVLHHAVKSSSTEIVQAVVEMGCPIDNIAQEKLAPKAEGAKESLQGDRLHVTVEEWSGASVVEDDMQSGGTTPLHLAILAQNSDMVRFLLSNGADVHKTTKTGCAAIHMAVRSGKASLVKEIVASGCDTDLKTHDGLSPLHLAAQWGHKDVAMELIGAGCNKEQLTGGKRKSKAVTALLIAAMKLQTEMVETLAEAGCQVQATTADGHNAIHLAVIAAQPTDYRSSVYRYVYYASGTGHSRKDPAESEALKTITVLLHLGCDINATNVDGQSPLDLAQRGYGDRYSYGIEQYHDCLDHMLRRLGARTGREMRHKATLSQTLDQVTESAQDIELKLASRPRTRRRLGMRTPRHQTWSVAIPNQVPSSSNLSRLVVPHVSHQWRDIGINLDIHPDRLDVVAADCSQDELECCMKVFNFWLNGEGKGPKTWNTVLDVLCTIGCSHLAESVLQQLHVYY